MEITSITLLTELDEQEAVKVCGGEGIRQDVSRENELSRDMGYQKKNQRARYLEYKNHGEAVSNHAQKVNGPN